MGSSRSRERSRERTYTHVCPRQHGDRRCSPARRSAGDDPCSRSRSRSVSPNRHSSSDAMFSGRSEGTRLGRETNRAEYWRQRGRSPLTKREVCALMTEFDGATGIRVLVAGLSSIVTEKDLKNKFSSFGNILDVCILKEGKTGEPRGIGILTLDPGCNVDAAVKAFDHTVWNGRVVWVERLVSEA